jgi:hypothetical protein
MFMKKQILHTSFVVTLSLLVSVTLVPQASADDSVDVAGNGAESANQVSTSHANETQSQSSNNMVVHNEVATKATTGENSASQNTTGDTKVVTGDAKASNEVTNSGNVTTVTGNCCATTNSSTTVAGNGAGSENTVNKSSTTTTSTTVTNNATITNNITIKANTGNNKADFNTGGNTSIKTGDVVVLNKITNGPINIVKVKAQGKQELESILKIAGNGAFSDNLVNVNNEEVIVTNVDNFASLFNNVEALMNTGNNSAEYNTGGDTTIVTGDIFASTIIENIANFSLVEVVCGCEEKPHKPNEETPNQPSAPAPPTTSVGGPGGPGPSGPGGPGTSSPASTTLPVTGNNVLFFLLLANIVMFFMGTYLRLRSGRSPSVAYSL